MKKVLCVFLALTFALLVTACGGNNAPEGNNDASQSVDENTTAAPISNAPGYNNGMKEHFEQLEYVSYCDLFYNKNYSDYENKDFTKTGTFGSIIDRYNGGITRYYVWGYADTTKCCSWQWEFKAPDGWNAPENGSVITVKGKLVADDASLDGFWFDNCEITVDEEFTKPEVDMDLTRISPTLVYVQVANMTAFPDAFANKTMRVYGRAYTTNTVQHPYYDGSWQLDFKWDGDVPSIGQYIVLTGTFKAENGGCVVAADDVQFVD